MVSKGKKEEIVDDSEDDKDFDDEDDEVILLLFRWKWKKRLRRRLKNYLPFKKKFRLLLSMVISSRKDSLTKNCKQSSKNVS